MRARLVLAAFPLLIAAACAPADEGDDTTAAPTGELTPGEGDCAKDQLALETDGQLTVATDSPAFEPWFAKNDPTNGQGFESAVAYAVADRLGFSEDEVTWVKVRFNNSYKPGPKDFDFDINQISITEDREKVVDFSEGYYSAAQGVIALKDLSLIHI